jgi:hypothetical protein
VWVVLAKHVSNCSLKSLFEFQNLVVIHAISPRVICVARFYTIAASQQITLLPWAAAVRFIRPMCGSSAFSIRPEFNSCRFPEAFQNGMPVAPHLSEPSGSKA